MTPSAAHYEIHLKDYLYILRKRRIIIVGFLILCLTASILLAFFEKVVFRTNATILIEKENPNVLDFKEVVTMDASSTEYYQTQYQMFRSFTLIEKLIKEENLLEDPYVLNLRKGFLRRFLKAQPWLPGWLQGFLAEPTYEDVIVRKMLKVDPQRNSRLVAVSILHPDPKRAMEMTNTLVTLFINRSIEDRFSISDQATGLISDQLSALKERVVKAEHKLQEYKEKTGLVNIPSLRQNNQFLQDARLELVKLQSEKAKLSKRYLPAHPKMIHSQSQIEGLQEKIQEEEKRILDLGRTAVDYAELEREANSSRKIYEALLQRLEETASEAQTQSSNIMIVDKAKLPSRPYRPQPLLNIMAGLLIGILGGVFLAFLVEDFDSTIKIPDDIEKGLGLELFGIIPKMDGDKKVFSGAKQQMPAAESIRALRTALLFKLRHQPGCRTILVTSPNPEEGKSTIAFNLSQAFGQNHLKVILIDADLRKPKMHKMLGVSPDKGLTDVLEGRLSLDAVIMKNAGNQGFDFLACGGFSERPTELLGSEAMVQLLKKLEEIYDIVLIDSPPYLAVADTTVLSEYAPAILIIAHHHKTEKRHLRDLRKRFSSPGLKALGVVINKVSVKERDYYYQQYYYYGYGDAARKK